MRRFECREGTSNEFWEITIERSLLSLRFGRLGTEGQKEQKSFASDALAEAQAKMLVAEKLAKGYVEVAVAVETDAGADEQLAGVTQHTAREHGAPRTPLEASLAAIWSELFGVASVGIDDDFFALGGNSRLATQLLSRVRSAYRVDLPLRVLFEGPSVASLAIRVLEAQLADDDAPLTEIEGMSDEEAIARLAALEETRRRG
jgi:predicted DNA-binding WGR domain protein